MKVFPEDEATTDTLLSSASRGTRLLHRYTKKVDTPKVDTPVIPQDIADKLNVITSTGRQAGKYSKILVSFVL